jgi:ribosomal protein S12 methylthiotransferase accessory factor
MASHAALARLAAGGRALAEAARQGAFVIGHWRAVKPASRVTAGGSPPPSAEEIAASLDLLLEDDASPELPLRSSAAVVRASGAGIEAVGAGETRAGAILRAVMEHAERTSLAQPDPPVAALAPFGEVRDRAIPPRDFGLYRDVPDGLGAFSEEEPLEWVEVEELGTGVSRLVPVELVFLRAPLSRLPLVAETSSGTAASFTLEAATLAALCEAIERDAFMLFWYRQPRTTVVAVSELPPSPARDDLHGVQELGFVVVVCRLDYDLGVPCVLVLALRGAELAYGLGCRPTPLAALAHAVRELGARLRWVEHAPPRTLLHRPLARTTTPLHHYELYHRGPLAPVLRGVLGRTLEPGPWPDRQADVPARLRRAGFRPYRADITTDTLGRAGIRVVRVLVPGLIPLHFGFDRLRLGCDRLTGDDAPGRLATLLPHFLD